MSLICRKWEGPRCLERQGRDLLCVTPEEASFSLQTQRKMAWRILRILAGLMAPFCRGVGGEQGAKDSGFSWGGAAGGVGPGSLNSELPFVRHPWEDPSVAQWAFMEPLTERSCRFWELRGNAGPPREGKKDLDLGFTSCCSDLLYID